MANLVASPETQIQILFHMNLAVSNNSKHHLSKNQRRINLCKKFLIATTNFEISKVAEENTLNPGINPAT